MAELLDDDLFERVLPGTPGRAAGRPSPPVGPVAAAVCIIAERSGSARGTIGWSLDGAEPGSA
jgi:hypothetical protein